MKKMISVFLILILVSLCAVSCAELNLKKPIKNFQVKTLDGEKFDLYKTLEEKDLVLIDMWLIQCPPCIDEIASVQEKIYEEYKDRIGFIFINGIDSLKDIQLFYTSRGLSLPFARNGIVNSWTREFPVTLLVNKEHYAIRIYNLDSPARIRYKLDKYLNMSNEEFKENAESAVRALGVPRVDDYETFLPISRCYYNAYNVKNDLSLTVECEGIKKIIVEDNLHIIQGNEDVGEFYIIPDETDHLKVTVHTLKGFKANKALMKSNTDFTETPFSKATRNKNDYTFDIDVNGWAASYSFYTTPSLGYVSTDSHVGFYCFKSEDDAESYFSDRGEQYYCSFPWHIETPDEEKADAAEQ